MATPTVAWFEVTGKDGASLQEFYGKDGASLQEFYGTVGATSDSGRRR